MMRNIFSFLRRGRQMHRNFSTTCTTLGTRGEKLQADAALCARSERLKSGADVLPCLSDVYKNGTRAKRRQVDAPLCGRSMVEMLGVLAIIGVLSVGAMTGYSKAMFKYKLNKQTEQINQIMMALVEYKSVLATLQNSESVIPLFRKLNALPPEMIKQDDNTYVYDAFNIPILLSRSGDGTAFPISFRFTGHSDKNNTICRNILESFKGYASEIYALGINSTTAEDINQQEWWYGNKAPEHDKKIHQLELNSMQSLCAQCDNNLCGIYAILAY